MIGGADIVVEGRTNRAERGLVARVLGAAWPLGVLHDVDAPPSAALPLPVRPSEIPAEFFVYRDAAALKSWARYGATRTNVDSMIHVIFQDDAITFVIDDESSATGVLISNLRHSIASHRISVDSGYRRRRAA